MPERLTFTLTGRDELSRVLNGTADSADRLRLRLSGITADSDGRLRDLRGRFLDADEAARRLGNSSHATRDSLTNLSDSAKKLGEHLKASLISLAPAAIPATAGLAQAAGVLAVQFGAVALSAAAYGLALAPQITAIGEAVKAQDKYNEAVRQHGATSEKAIKAQVEYQQALAALPPETQKAAVAVGLLKTNFQDWSDSLSGDVMGPFNKGVAVANALIPETTGLVKGASGQFDRLITLVGGAISTPGFDALNDRVTDFADRTLDHAVDELTIFLAKLESGNVGGGGDFERFLDLARDSAPEVLNTLENLGEALLSVLQAGSEVGVGMLDVINILSGIVSAVPPEAIATMLQLAIAIKAVRLAAVGTDAAKAALLALGTQIMAMRTAAAGAPGVIGGVTAAIGGLSRGAKLALAGTGIGLLLVALGELSSRSQKAPPDVDKLTTSLKILADTGRVSGEAARAFGKDLSGLGDSLQKVTDPEGLDQVQQSIISFFGTDSTPIKNAKEDIDAFDKALAGLVSSGNAKLAASALRETIAQLEAQGKDTSKLRSQLDDYNDALAGQALEQRLAAQSMGLFGDQAQKVQAQLDAQKQSADGLRQSIQALNDANRAGLSGMIGFEAAIDAASKAAKDNAGVLDMQGGKLTLNTDKQRAAAQALNDLAAKTDEAAASTRESGGSWAEVAGIYERGRQQLIKNAEQMGLTKQEAAALADQILKTPDKTAMLKADISDWQEKIATAEEQLKTAKGDKRAELTANIADWSAKVAAAERQLAGAKDSKQAKLTANIADWRAKIANAERQLKTAKGDKRAQLTANIRDWQAKVAAAQRQINNLPRSKSSTLTVTYRTVFETIGSAPKTTADLLRQQADRFKAQGGIIRRASGGPIPGFPGGGLLQGPGTPTSDSIPIWASTGEYVVKAASVAKYGVKFLDALNAGRLPTGQAAPRPGLAAATAPARQPQTPQAGGEFTGTLVLDSGQFLGVVRGTVQPMIRASEQEQAHRAKVGRR
ncbi:hypothetical protein [Streptomyces sp. NPDC003299]